MPLREGEPTTRLQFRLPSGEQFVGRFNPNAHTLAAEVRAFVVAARSELAFAPFEFALIWPKRTLTNEEEEATLAAAGVANSVLLIKPSALVG